jgi:hypothetical protein
MAPGRFAWQSGRTRSSNRVSATLAAAYAESGRFNDAISAADRAIDLAVAEHNDSRAAAIRRQQDLYRNNQPFHESH